MTEFKLGLLKYFDDKSLAKIESVKVGIAGAGGLGSNCAFNLVRSGFMDFVIADFDIVEPSNLNRQFFFTDQIGMPKVEALEINLRRINPEILFYGRQILVQSDNIDSLFGECDVIVEAFDRAEYKKLIIEHFAGSGKLLVSASGIAGVGNSDEIITRKINRNFYIIGDGKSSVSETNPPFSPKVNIAAAKQADCVLEWVLANR